MSAERLKQVQTLFELAVHLPPTERVAFLDRSCGGDAELRTEVEALLAHDDQAPADFMRPPEPSPTPSAASMPPGTPSLVGQRVGNYHVTAVIGGGGMGTVYEAVQEHPHRTVALKIMNRNIASTSALRRFQFEAQVLGRLRHPNVAQVYEAGMHGEGPGGVPFFAMEYIPGARAITRCAVERELGTTDRLRLFAKVCEAVHHGHQKGIIHRDLKPANILVDSSGEPKIIDFGVARATDSDLAVTTQQTHVGQLVGTMQYMSPEQCDADPHDLDTRSDVYSLGVVLYELLTGELPYEATGSSVYQVTRTIKEQAPRRPSSINPKLRGDLETVALKALEKDRQRRYQSAAELAEDIRRVVSGEPIVARPPSVTYLVRKYVGRHRWQAAAVGTSALTALALLVSVSVWGWAFKVNEARKIAVDERTRAEEARGRAVHEKEVARITAYGAALGAAEAALQVQDAANSAEILRRVAKPLNERPAWEWRHLHGRVDQSIATITDDSFVRLGTRVGCMAVDPSGQWVALGDTHRTVELYNIASGNLQTLGSPDVANVFAAAFSGDGSHLALAEHSTREPDCPGVVSLWRISPDSRPVRLSTQIESQRRINLLACHPSKPVLAVSTGDAIELWDLTKALALEQSDDRPGAGLPVRLTAGGDNISRITFSADGKFLAACLSGRRVVCLWDVVALRSSSPPPLDPVAVLAGFSFHILGVAFSADGRQLATGCADGVVQLWDVKRSLEEAAKTPTRKVSVADVAQQAVFVHSGPVKSVAFDPSGDYLISGGSDGVLRIWYLGSSTDRSPRELRGHSGPINFVTVLPDRRVVSASNDGSAKLWYQGAEDVPRLTGHQTSVASVRFEPQGRFLVSGDGAYHVAVWDTESGVRTYLMPVQGINDLAIWSVRGRTFVATAGGDISDPERQGGVGVCELNTEGRLRLCWKSEPDIVFMSVAASADGKRLAAGDSRGFVRIWTLPEQSAAGSDVPPDQVGVQAHADFVHALVFLDEKGQWLVSAAGRWSKTVPERDHSIRIWDLHTGQPVMLPECPQQHGDGVRVLALSSNRDLLASGSLDQTVRLWDVEWDDGVPRLVPRAELKGHTEPVVALAFHPSEPRLASGSQDRTIKIWDLKSGVEVATLRGHRGAVRDLDFDPAGMRLASASAGSEGTDNVVWLWEAPQDEQLLKSLRDKRNVAYWAREAVRKAVAEAMDNRGSYARALARVKEITSVGRQPWERIQQLAIERFDDLISIGRVADWFNYCAWSVASRSDGTRDEYEEAVGWAEKACRVATRYDLGQCLNTLGAAQYRCGQYEKAAATLERSGKLNNWHPADSLFLAMARSRLGDTEGAKQALEEARQRSKETDVQGWCESDEGRGILSVAKQLIEGSASGR